MRTSADLSGLDRRGFVPELEQQVLGALLQSGSVSPVAGRVKVEHWIEPFHRRIFEMMLLSTERYKSARIDVVHRMFPPEEAEAYAKQLGMSVASYLASLAANCVYGVAGLTQAVPNMLQQWARISLSEEADRVAAAACDPAADPIDRKSVV